MGYVYAADSVWQGVVGGWCSTAIIWAQGWRVMEEELAESGRRREAHWRCFLLDISQILPMCVCATAMTTLYGNGAWAYLYILVFL